GIQLPRLSADILDKVADKHVRLLLDPSVFSLNNHGIFQIHGLRLLLSTFSRLSTQERVRYAEDRMADLVNAQFDANGVHLEHSPHYHFFATDLFKRVASSGLYDSAGLTHTVEKADKIARWLVDP